ncbi:M1-specific T cell receptor beta chain-like [Centropristis striata]|uniref:M1-specific T cell receptor beta chain-like n=1 Tax=Centropristis striata TaxID=184440 RepID=UPI0027DFFEB6|nr:M1-specific T cell receptor beta chain-like [Centropristis striata]
MTLNLAIKHNNMFVVFCIALNIILVSGSSLSDQVHQTPADINKKPEETAEITCSHSIESYNRILWYKQLKNKELQFLGYMLSTADNPEPGLGVKVKGSANKDQNCTLIIEGLSLNSSAVYFCACDTGSEAYFGKGTKLTVLETGINITAPTVKVLRPSCNEYRNQKDNTTKKTIVCVASGFYPDHVTVQWKDNKGPKTSGVATDSAALRGDNGFYTITSRLRVPGTEWFKPGSNFTCTVSFYNGTHTEDFAKSIRGEDGNAMTRGKYLKRTQIAKLSYGVLIVKSCIYGVFVVFLVWKLQSSSRKQR